MKEIFQIFAWYVMINFSVCNEIWTKPVPYWWVIEIVVLIISILIVDKGK